MAEDQDEDEAPVKSSKAGKAAKPVKAKAKKQDSEDTERARKYPESLKIKVLNKENPHREGSGRGAAFEAVKKCKTMGDYYETGHKVKYIGAWIESNHIEVG